jgi:hypothetical protein
LLEWVIYRQRHATRYTLHRNLRYLSISPNPFYFALQQTQHHLFHFLYFTFLYSILSLKWSSSLVISFILLQFNLLASPHVILLRFLWPDRQNNIYSDGKHGCSASANLEFKGMLWRKAVEVRATSAIQFDTNYLNTKHIRGNSKIK